MGFDRLRGATPPPAAPLLVAAVVLNAVLLTIDLLPGAGDVPPSAFGVAPLLPMLSGSMAATASAVVVSWAMVGGATVLHAPVSDIDGYVRIAVVIVLGLLAILGAIYRRRLADAIGHLSHLEEFSAMVEGRLTLRETADGLCALLVPRVGDLATIDVSVKEGEVRRLGAACVGRSASTARGRLLEGPDVPRQAGPGIRAAMEWGDTSLVERVGEHRSRNAAEAREFKPGMLDEDGIPCLNSFLVVPLRSRGRVLGAMTLATTGQRHLGSSHLAFAQSLANRAAVALDNAGLWAELIAAERQLVQALGGLGDAVTIHDESGLPSYANQAAADLVGVATPEELIASEAGDLRNLPDLRNEDGSPVGPKSLPGHCVFDLGSDCAATLSTTDPRSGSRRWYRIRATPLHGSDGAVVAAVNIIEDLTAEKREEQRQRFLAEAGEVLGSSLDYESTLQRAASLAVRGLADWCAVDLLDERGNITQVAVAHRDPNKVALARELRDRYPVDMDRQDGLAEVLRTGEPQLFEEIDDDMVVAAARDSDHLALIREIGFCSAIIAPMRVGPRTIGAITLVDAESNRRFDQTDLELALDLARRAAIAVENSRLYAERGKIASTLQEGLLPPALPDVPGFELASVYRAAGDANEVGGDFYDVVPLDDDTWLAVIGDVVGKGAPAAALTARVRHTLTSLTSVSGDPASAFERLDKTLVGDTTRGLCSAAIVIVSEERLRICRAGHPAPLLIRGGVPELIGEPGPMLGLGQTEGWTETTIDLLPGDTIILYTDGVLDTVGESDRFGERRLMSSVAGDVTSEGAEAVAVNVESAVENFQVGPQRDDVAVLILQREGTTPSPASIIAGGEPGRSQATHR